jgi:hypothetical protein
LTIWKALFVIDESGRQAVGGVATGERSKRAAPLPALWAALEHYSHYLKRRLQFGWCEEMDEFLLQL